MLKDSNKLISIVIPNWNGRKFLEKCLPSLERQTYSNYEIIIIDNGSTDGSTKFIKENFPLCRSIVFFENRGFSVAVNAGIQASKGEYIALLNNDTEADADWLKELAKTLAENPQVGFCASKMMAYNDRTVIDDVGDGYIRGGMAHKIGWAEKDRGQYEESAYVFGACAGAAIYRKELFGDIGLFDEDFFAYLEDVDISFRAQLAGYKCLYVPRAIIYHIGSATTGGRFNNTTVYLSAKNYLNVLVKNLPDRLWKKDFLRIIGVIFVTLLKNIIRGRGIKLAWAYMRGLIAGFKQMPVMRVKRRVIQGKKQVTAEYIRNLMMESEHKVRLSKKSRKSKI